MLELTNRHGIAFAIVIDNILKVQYNKTNISNNEYFNVHIIMVSGITYEAREDYKFIVRDIKAFYNKNK